MKEDLVKVRTKNLTAWDIVEIARSPKRKTAIEYIDNIFDEFIELHGDRTFKDDKSMICRTWKNRKTKFYSNC